MAEANESFERYIRKMTYPPIGEEGQRVHCRRLAAEMHAGEDLEGYQYVVTDGNREYQFDGFSIIVAGSNPLK